MVLSSRSMVLLCSLAAATLVARADGAVIVTTEFEQGASPFTPTYVPSTTDLINGLSPSASSGNFTVEESGGLPALTDGSFGVIDRGATTAARNIRFAVGGSGAGT